MRLMRLIFLRHFLFPSWRRRLRDPWNRLLANESFKKERRFYRQFIEAGDFVMDIGANVGFKTRVMLSLGARVLAVEPNPMCVEQLKKQNALALTENRLLVKEVAVGSNGGQLTLYLNPQDHTTTTGSYFFRSATEKAGANYASTIQVSVMTLDELIAIHGKPSFVKIDVEGMDWEVLKGLGFRPRFLSFEFSRDPVLWTNLSQCLKEVARLGFKKANFTGSGAATLRLKDWVSIEKIEGAVATAANPEGFGDIVVA